MDDTPTLIIKQASIIEQIEKQDELLAKLLLERTAIKPTLALKEMPTKIKYNKLKQESKNAPQYHKNDMLQSRNCNSKRVITLYKRCKAKKRMLVKQIIGCNVDIMPNHENKTLSIILHSFSTPRHNDAAEKLAILLNQTETILPSN